MNPPRINPLEPRWVFEVRSLCLELQADCSTDGQSVVVRTKTTVLRLTDFHDYLLVKVGLSTPQGPHWVGFLTLKRSELPEFLRNTLPIPQPDLSKPKTTHD